MTLNSTQLAGLGLLAMIGAANAQTTPPPAVPNTTAPDAVTPPSSTSSGVIRPTRPVDSKMVKRPPTSGQHKMPVIRPPGIAR